MRLLSFLVPVFVAACVGSDDSTALPDAGSDATTQPDTGLDARPEADAPLVCEAGTANCSAMQSGCETNLTNDTNNCGACGHACGGPSLCTGGVCSPMPIATNVTPISMAVSGTSAFWVTNGELQRCPITGCTTPYPGDVGDGVHPPEYSTQGPDYIAVDTTNVYWPGYTTDEDNPAIYFCVLAGCGGVNPAAISATSDNYSTQMVGNTANLYWVNGNDGSVVRVRKSDHNVVGLNIPYLTALTNIAADDVHVLLTDSSAPVNGGGLYVCSTAASDCSGGFPLLLDTAQHVATNGTLAIVNQPSTGSIVTCNLAMGCSGSGTVLTTGETGVQDITADANNVFWAIKGTGTNGTIRMCALPSCAGGPQTLASNQATPRSMTNDPTFVYWANQGSPLDGGTTSGAIMRVAKPL